MKIASLLRFTLQLGLTLGYISPLYASTGTSDILDKLEIESGLVKCYNPNKIEPRVLDKCNLTVYRAASDGVLRHIVLYTSTNPQPFRFFFDKNQQLMIKFPNDDTVKAKFAWTNDSYLCYNRKICVNAVQDSHTDELTAMPLE